MSEVGAVGGRCRSSPCASGINMLTTDYLGLTTLGPGGTLRSGLKYFGRRTSASHKYSASTSKLHSSANSLVTAFSTELGVTRTV